MQDKKPIKRFIAGAVCPQCQAGDSIVCFYEQDKLIRECVECHLREKVEEQEDVSSLISVKQID